MISKLLVTFFGIGHIQFAPGTIASLVSIVLLTTLKHYTSIYLFSLIFIILLALSYFVIKKYIKNLDIKDAQEIVLDEVLGIYLILIFFKIDYDKIFFDLIIIIALFRFFDILKIFPANLIDKKFKNSFGIIFDDLISSIYTLIVLLIINLGKNLL